VRKQLAMSDVDLLIHHMGARAVPQPVSGGFLAGQRMRQWTGRAREVSPLRLQTQNLTIASKAARVNGEQVSVLGWLGWRLSVRRVAKLRRMIISKLFMLLSVAFAGKIRRSSFKGRTARPIRAFDS
jgi:hypothetical protein